MVLAKPQDDPVLELFDLTGKIVAVTGGGGGIGLALCTAYAEAGAQVAVFYNMTATAPKTAEDIALQHGVKCQAYQADITVPAQISAAIHQVVQDYGKLDVVVANASICSKHAGEEYTPEEFQEIMDVNFNGAFYTAQAAVNIFKTQGFGNVVFTASVSAMLVNTPQRQAATDINLGPGPQYNASKAGVLQLAKSPAVEWVGFYRVNCVLPGYIQTSIMEYASPTLLET